MSILPGLPGGPAYRPFVEPTFAGSEESPKFEPLKGGEKGVILWAGVQVDPSGATMSGLPIAPQELRTSLLLWDRLDWPSNDFLSRPSGPDEEFLITEGILRRSRFRTGGGDILAQIVRTNGVALEEAEKREPGRWSLSRGSEITSPIVDPLLHDRSVLVRLYECIPVPHREVPLAEILEFKHRRRDELKDLHHHLERIYQRILAAPDREMAEETELAALDRAMAAHVKAINEAPFRKVLGSVEASLDLPTLGGAVVSGVAAFSAGLPLTSALLSGAGAFGVTLGLGRVKDRQSPNPFEYVTRAHKDLF